MAISEKPVIGYQNLVDHADSILSSVDIAAGSQLSNIQDPNLGVVATFAAATEMVFDVDFGSAKSVGGFFIRFRDGYGDIASVRLQLSTTSDHSAPLYDSVYSGQIPTSWSDVGIPVRPIYRSIFDAVSPRYARVTIECTAGTDPLDVARVYIGPVLQLDGIGPGYAAYGTSVSVQKTSVKQQSDIDVHFKFSKAQIRTAKIKLEGASDSQARTELSRKLGYAAANSEVLYVYDPLETDPDQIQFETLWAEADLGELVAESYNFWEATLSLEERL